jgi:hypothetical protein
MTIKRLVPLRSLTELSRKQLRLSNSPKSSMFVLDTLSIRRFIQFVVMSGTSCLKMKIYLMQISVSILSS